MEPSKVAAILQKIADSPLSLREYFQTRSVPFSLAQYSRYKARYSKEGVSGLRDRRGEGHRRKITKEAKSLLLEVHRANPGMSLRELGEALKRGTGIEVAPSTLSEFLAREGERPQWPRPREAKKIFTPCGGLEIIAAVSLHLGWVKHTAEVILQERKRFRKTTGYRNQRSLRDRKGRNALGQFTRSYNLREDIRQNRFASVEDKRKNKNYSHMSLFGVRESILIRKCMGILSLPVVTLNGTTRSINLALGNAIAPFSGYNYKHHTLDKFLRELKYLGISERLLRDQISFWRTHWEKLPSAPSGLPFHCYYIDGNTRPLWSSKRVKKNKVTMLGRVMGCVELVVIHDAFGHPMYFESHPGKAPVGEYTLSLFEKLQEALEGPGPPLRVQRAIVMDAANNGVGTLRAFAGQNQYHYITSLDENQWHPRKILKKGRPKRYYYGEATLRDCVIELEDSNDKGYVVVVRAILIEWDNDKTTVLITSFPKDMVGASLVVKAYFDRWPCQELQFKGMKSFASLHRVAGYGKKKLPDEKVRQTQKELEEKITMLRHRLRPTLKTIAEQEVRVAKFIEKHRRIRSQCVVDKGKRIATQEQQDLLKELARKMARCKRAIKRIESGHEKELRRLRTCEKKWVRLQGKEYVYRIDVELDQIMTFFRIALVNHISWFLHYAMKNRRISLTKLLHSILLLHAEIELTKNVRHVRLHRNPKDPKGMARLEKALQRLNNLEVRHLDGKRIQFSLI